MNKTIIYSIGLLALASCHHGNDFDACGYFDATTVTLSAECSGKILDFNVEEGDSITRGQVIAQIDTTLLHYQKLQLVRQHAASGSTRPEIDIQLSGMRRELDKQKHERERIGNLLTDGAATAKQLDDINAAITILEKEIAARSSTLRNTAASVDETAAAINMQICQIAERISNCRIVAPLTGTVLTKYCEAGEFAVPGKPLAKVADLSRIYLKAYFTSLQLAEIRLGQQVTVIADFGADKVYEYPGKITWISDESEFTPKNIQTKDSRANLVYAVKIAVINDGRLKIGGYGEVRL